MKPLGWIVAVVVLATALTGIATANDMALWFQRRDPTLTTSDGVKIAATYTDNEKASSGGLILLHMMNRTRADWEAFSAVATEHKFCSIAIDLRGHGQSTQGPDGKKLDWRQFKDVDFQGMIRDVEAAYDFLIKEKNVDPQRIGIVGASIGANLAVKYAAEHPGRISALVLLSPGRNYRGVKIDEDVNRFPGKMFFYASKGDKYSYDSCVALAAAAKDHAKLETPENGDAHGTNLLAENPYASSKMNGGFSRTRDILRWLKQNI